MGMDAHILNQRAAAISKDRTRKVIFFDVDGVLLNTNTGRFINENNLLFTLSHLWQAGHLLAIATGIPHTDKKQVALIHKAVAYIKQKTGVPLMLLTPQSFSSRHCEEALLNQYRQNQTSIQGKNATIMLSLASCRLYCKPNALQRGLIQDPRSTLPGHSKAIHDSCRAIASEQVVLVDDNANMIQHAKTIGYQGILAHTHVCTANGKAAPVNQQYLQQLLANYTALAQCSVAWLHRRHATQSQHAQQANQDMAWIHYQYYLKELHPNTKPQQSKYIHKRVWQQYAPKRTSAWVHDAQQGVAMVVVGGVAVACISIGITMGGIGGAMGAAALGVGLKVMLAKAGVGFGIGSASGSLMMVWKKCFFWRKRQRKKRALSKWLKSQQMINAMLQQAEQNKLDLHELTQAARTQSTPLHDKSCYTSWAEQMAHSLEHRSSHLYSAPSIAMAMQHAQQSRRAC